MKPNTSAPESYYLQIEECERQVKALHEALSEPEVETLRLDCEAIGAGGLRKWLREKEMEIVQFINYSDADRNRFLVKGDIVQKGRLVLGAILHLRFGQHMMQVIDSMDVKPSAFSPRTDAYAAGIAAKQIIHNDIPLWPFSDPVPFPEKE